MSKTINPREWKTLSTKLNYQSPWIKIFEDKVIRPDGKDGTYSYLDKPPGVMIIALDEKDHIYFVKEYRYVHKKVLIQLPSGAFDENDDPIENAKRELKEETGIIAKEWKNLGEFLIAPGHETTKMYSILATDLDTSNIGINQEGDESILEIVKHPIHEIKKLINTNKIECGLTISTLMFFFINKKLITE